MVLKVVGQREGIRCIPCQRAGCLRLLYHEPSDNLILTWGDDDNDNHCNKDPKTLFDVIPSEWTSIDSQLVAEVFSDSQSMTLLVITKRDSNSTQPFYLFHPFHEEEEADDGFVSLLRSYIQPESVAISTANASATHPSHETISLGVLETFSKVSRFYIDTAKYLWSGQDLSKRPRRIDDNEELVAINPWILSRQLDLPSSRRKDPQSIPIDCDEKLFKLLIFTSGSVKDERIQNWQRLFSTNSTIKIDQEIEKEATIAATAFSLQASAESKNRIEKDVFRTDREMEFYYPKVVDIERDLQRPHLKSLYSILEKYASEHSEIDYVQGMNDIASPILFTMEEEDVAYKVFNRVMEKQMLYYAPNGNHTAEQLSLLAAMLQTIDPLLYDRLCFTSDNASLFFAYRWLLLLFKREVGFLAYPLILETIYSSPTPSFELFIALALILMYKDSLIQFGHKFDLTLQFFSEKAGKHDVSLLLNLADQLHQYFYALPALKFDPQLAKLYVC